MNVIEWGMDKSFLRQRKVMFITSDTLTRAVSEAISKHINRSLYLKKCTLFDNLSHSSPLGCRGQIEIF